MKHIRRTNLLLALFLMLAFACVLFWSVHSTARQARLNSQLIAAVNRGDSVAVKSLLNQGADPNTREDGVPPASWLNRVIAQLLHRKRTQTYSGRPLLTRAAGAGYTQIFAALLAKGAAVNAKTDTPPDDGMTLGQGGEDDWSLSPIGGTALTDAAGNDRTVIALSLINAGADVNARDADGESVLMYAAMGDNLRLVRALIVKGADIQARDKYGDTPLINATFLNNFASDKIRSASVEALLATGADVNAADSDGSTALMETADNGPPGEKRIRTAQVLLAHGANVNVRDRHGETALTMAERAKHGQIASLLRQAGAKQ